MMSRWGLLVCLMGMLLVGCGRLTAKTPIMITGLQGDPFARTAAAQDISTTLPQRQLLIAAFTGDKGAIRKIKKSGADLNATDPMTGMTALHMAVNSKEVEPVKLLVEAGCDVNKQMDNGGPTPLYDAVCGNDDKMVAFLLAHGANPDVRDRYLGAGLLHLTAIDGQTTIAKQLIKAGIDIDLKDRNGATALHMAASCNQPAMIELLAKSGGDVNAKSNRGYTPLDVAMRRPDHPETVEMLKKYGAK